MAHGVVQTILCERGDCHQRRNCQTVPKGMYESRYCHAHWSPNGSRVCGTTYLCSRSCLFIQDEVRDPSPCISDGSEIKPLHDKVSAALGKYVAEHASPKPDTSLTFHLVARLTALYEYHRYHDKWLQPPQQIAWLLLALHQVFFEDVGIAHPRLCGYADSAPQTIRQAVNVDLRKIFSLATGDSEISHRRLEYFKVNSPLALVDSG